MPAPGWKGAQAQKLQEDPISFSLSPGTVDGVLGLRPERSFEAQSTT